MVWRSCGEYSKSRRGWTCHSPSTSVVTAARDRSFICTERRLSGVRTGSPWGTRASSAAPGKPARFGSARRRLCLGPTALDAICAAWSARFTTTCAPPPSERARYGPSRSVTLRPGSPRSGSWAPPNEPPGSPVRMLFRGASRPHHRKGDTRRAELRRAAVVDASVAARVRRDARPPRERRRVVGRGFFFSTSPIPPNGRLVVMVVD